MPVFRRFFIYCSYYGRHYNGVAFTKRKNCFPVANVLLNTIKKVQPDLDLTDIQTSSRTDQGVNALCNVLHFNTKYLGDVNPTWLRAETNEILRSSKDDIRVQFIREVDPNKYHCRHNASSRTYLYRISAYEDLPDRAIYQRPLNLVPYFPWQPVQGWLVPGPLAVDKIQEAVSLLHNVERDYTGFTNMQGLLSTTTEPVRTLSVTLNEVQQESQFLERLHPAFNLPIKHYDLKIEAKSFLYKMVRFIAGSMVSVGQNKMTIDDFKHILSDGAEYLQNKPFAAGRSNALFLVNVQYDDPVLQLKYEEIKNEMLNFKGLDTSSDDHKTESNVERNVSRI